VKVIHKRNGGCASARNAGLQAATGDFVAFVDADDWVDENMFEELYRSAILNATDVAQCGFLEAFEDSGRLDFHPTAWGATSANGTSGLVQNPRSFLTVKPTIWRRIYKRTFLLDNGIHFPEHIRRFDDLPFQFEVLARVKRMSVIPDCFYYYRQEREGQDIAVTDQRLFVHFPIFKWLHEKVGVWADHEIATYLNRCKVNTHFWALSRIDAKYRGLYLSHAAHDLFAGDAKPSLKEMLRLMRSGLPMLNFIGSALVRSKFSKPPIIAFD
jgi:glycosyltransferase involved in cell wall biosynthesis